MKNKNPVKLVCYFNKVGMFETKGSQPISLNKNGCLYESIVAHELVHALGNTLWLRSSFNSN